MFSYGQEKVEVIFAFVESRRITGYGYFASGRESAVVRYYRDRGRSFGNSCYNAFFYCCDICVRTVPGNSRYSSIFRDNSRGQCPGGSRFQG